MLHLLIFGPSRNKILMAWLYFQVVLDSDDPKFGGFNRISHDAEYFTFVSRSSYAHVSNSSYDLFNN